MTEIITFLFGLESVSFRYPVVLNALFLAPVLCLLFAAHLIRSSKMLEVLDVKSSYLRRIFQAASAIFAWIFLVMTLAEPYGTEIFRKPVWKGEVVDFVIDLSLSQNAEDVKPRRLEAGKKAILEAADTLNSEGITTLCLAFFTYSFNRLLECTPDIDNFKAIVGRLDPALAGNFGGTNLLAAIPSDYEMIKNEVIPRGSRITMFLITDGGLEMLRDKATGAMLVTEPDWKEEELKSKITELSAKGTRIIPVGIGGTKPAPVTIDSETFYSLLDEKIIKKIALWAGSPQTYFIMRDGDDFGKWISEQVIMNRVADHYATESKETGLWKYFLLAGIFFASSAFGIFGIFEKISDKYAKRR